MQRVNEFELPYRGGDRGVKYLMRGPHLDWGVILMRPGDTLAPHYHAQVEETFYVVRGRGSIKCGGSTQALVVGDVYRMEPGDDHEIACGPDEELKLVFIKTPYLPDDKVDL